MEKKFHRDICILVIQDYKIQYQVQRWVTTTYFFKVTEANEGKRFSSWYLRTHNLHYVHLNTSDNMFKDG